MTVIIHSFTFKIKHILLDVLVSCSIAVYFYEFARVRRSFLTLSVPVFIRCNYSLASV